jgi:integrase/recombinase XerD
LRRPPSAAAPDDDARSRRAAPASQAVIDRFIDALWLEDGLSRNTLAAYRRDLTAGRLAGMARGPRPGATRARPTCWPTLRPRHAATRATTANRRLTVFKRYFRWALRERRLVEADPTLRLLAARQPLRVPAHPE